MSRTNGGYYDFSGKNIPGRRKNNLVTLSLENFEKSEEKQKAQGGTAPTLTPEKAPSVTQYAEPQAQKTSVTQVAAPKVELPKVTEPQAKTLDDTAVIPVVEERLPMQGFYNTASSRGAAARQSVSEAFKTQLGEIYADSLFDGISDEQINAKIPYALDIVQSRIDSGQLTEKDVERLPNLVDGLAVYYAAGEAGNKKLANKAYKVAYIKDEKAKPATLQSGEQKSENTVKAEGDWSTLDTVSTLLTAASFIPGVDTVTNAAQLVVDLIRGDYKSAGLDALGMIPFAGEVADVIKAGGSASDLYKLLKRAVDLGKLATMFSGGLKFVDKATDAARVADKVIDTAKVIDKTADTARVVDKATDAGKVIDKTADTARVVDKTADAGKVADKAGDFADFPKTIHEGRQGKHIVGHNNYKTGKSIFDGTADDAKKLITEYGGTGVPKGPNKETIDFKKIIGYYIDPETGKTYATTKGTIHYSKDGAHIVPARPKNFK